MNVLVLGHLVLDEIHTEDGPLVQSLGGIFFPVSAFNALAGTGDSINAVFPVGSDAWSEFRKSAEALDFIDFSRCEIMDRPNTRVRLFHDSRSEYNTQLVSSLESIPFTMFSPVLGTCDLVYINMMTGDDVTLETAERLKEYTKGLLYLDLHMVAYKVASGGHRFPSPVQEWRRWADIPDILQCNERELAAISDGDLTEEASAARLLSNSRLQHLVITKGERGAVVYSAGGGSEFIAASPPVSVVDSTGCGDVFGTTLAYFLARGEPVARAGSLAAAAASYVLSIPGSIGIGKLRSHLEGVLS